MGAWVVGIILVGVAAFSIVAVMYVVMRERHEPEEHYDPNQPESAEPQQTTTGATISAPATQKPAHEGSE